MRDCSILVVGDLPLSLPACLACFLRFFFACPLTGQSRSFDDQVTDRNFCEMDLSLDELAVAIGYAALFISGAPASAAPAAKAAAPAKAPVQAATPAKKVEEDDDFDNMFADEEEETAEEKAANAARHERMAQALKLKEEKEAKEGKVKKEKAKVVEKSLVVLEVKPWEGITLCILHSIFS
jgi:hypothetical protein